MKLQQIRFLCEVVESLNVTTAARNLHTSQSGVSRQVRLLEEELGTPILNRDGRRITGLTEAGQEIFAAARRVLADADELRSVAAALQRGGQRQLSVATTHVHARYALLPAVQAFAKAFPQARLKLVQVFDNEVRDLVDAGQVDLGICTRPGEAGDRLAVVPLYPMARGVIAPARHPLLRLRRPKLADLARYPLILYDTRMSTGTLAHESFAAAKVVPNVVVTAMDADVIKAYVAAGLGIAVIPAPAFNPRIDTGLRFVPLDHAMAPTTTHLLLRRGRYLHPEMVGFLREVAPGLSKAQLERQVK